MSRLILFSGGVESTAMLTLRNPQDIITTVRDTSKSIYRNYNEKAVEEIAKHLGVKIHYTDIAIPIEHKKNNLYQLLTFVHIAGLWVTRFPSIKEVWYGLKKGEPIESMRKEFDWCVDMWGHAYPNTKLSFPFKDMEKGQIWKLIPDDLKPLVINCNEVNPCHTCSKCTELQKLRMEDDKN